MRASASLLFLALLWSSAPEAVAQGTGSAPPERAYSSSTPYSSGAAYQAGEAVEIEWHGSWYPGHVLEVEGDQYKVHYDGYGDSWDEWVGTDRLRSVEASVEAEEAPDPAEEASTGAGAVSEAEADVEAGASVETAPAPSSAPPLGKYVCRQYMTTMGYLTLRPGGRYEVSGVTGRYRYDSGTGEMEWLGGSYADWEWEGRYEHVSRPAGDGRPDEDVIRLRSEADRLRINCYYMAQNREP